MKTLFMKWRRRNNKIACLFWVLLALSGNLSAQTDDETIAGWRQILKTEGLNALVADIRAHDQEAPLIYSQWWVDLPDNRDRRNLEQKKHDFGLLLAKAMLADEPRLQKLLTAEQRETAVRQLLDFSDWIARPAYGNLHLHARAQNLAAIPLAYLTADLTYPEEKIEQLISRFNGYNTEDEIQVQVLNQELGENRFALIPDRDDHYQFFKREQVWYVGLRKMQDWCAGREIAHHRCNYQSRARMPRKLAFYADDENRPKALDTATRWNFKTHENLSAGISPNQLLDSVKSLLLFRQKIGYFPTTPPNWWNKEESDEFYTAITAAFDVAWGPFRIEYGPKYGRAARLYEKILAGKVDGYR